MKKYLIVIEAIAFHLDGLREEGQAVPEPQSYSAYVELSA